MIKLRNEQNDLDYEVEDNEFIYNEDVRQLHLDFFAEYYNISKESARRIFDDFDLFSDENEIEFFLDHRMEEVDEIFFNYDWVDPDNRCR